MVVIILLWIGVVLLHLIQAYFWQFDAATGDCAVRQEVTVHGIRSVWTVWSWVTELLVFGVVPLAMLALNALVIAETRRMAVIEHQRVTSEGPLVHSQHVPSHGHHPVPTRPASMPSSSTNWYRRP